jgi:hypothetical protein
MFSGTRLVQEDCTGSPVFERLAPQVGAPVLPDPAIRLPFELAFVPFERRTCGLACCYGDSDEYCCVQALEGLMGAQVDVTASGTCTLRNAHRFTSFFIGSASEFGLPYPQRGCDGIGTENQCCAWWFLYVAAKTECTYFNGVPSCRVTGDYPEGEAELSLSVSCGNAVVPGGSRPFFSCHRVWKGTVARGRR